MLLPKPYQGAPFIVSAKFVSPTKSILFFKYGIFNELPVVVPPESAVSLLKNELACMPSSKSASRPEPEPSTVLTFVSTSAAV